MEQLRRKLMHILSEETTTSINQLAELDTKCINLAFHVSQVIGLAQLSSTITDYSNFYLKSMVILFFLLVVSIEYILFIYCKILMMILKVVLLVN